MGAAIVRTGRKLRMAKAWRNWVLISSQLVEQYSLQRKRVGPKTKMTKLGSLKSMKDVFTPMSERLTSVDQIYFSEINRYKRYENVMLKRT